MPGSVGRLWTRWAAAAAAVAVGLAGDVAAQAPPSAPLPRPTPLPAQPLPTPVPGPPAPPPLLEAPPSVFAGPPPGPVVNPAALDPLPGSLEDDMNRLYEARKKFRICTYNGTTVTGFPGTLLWLPPLAGPLEPRMKVVRSTLSNYDASYSIDTQIGGTIGLFRAEPEGHDVAYQLDLFAVVNTRLTAAELLAADYRFGFPVTFRWGDWSGKIGYEHTSAHLGDKFIRDAMPAQIPNYQKNEVVAGLSRWVLPDLRVYGVAAYAFNQQLPPAAPGLPEPTRSPYRVGGGFEWVPQFATGFAGSPFVAVNVDSKGSESYNPDLTAQVGWFFRNPYQRLANARVFIEYYDGYSPFGQFYLTREKFTAVGIAGDY